MLNLLFMFYNFNNYYLYFSLELTFTFLIYLLKIGLNKLVYINYAKQIFK